MKTLDRTLTVLVALVLTAIGLGLSTHSGLATAMTLDRVPSGDGSWLTPLTHFLGLTLVAVNATTLVTTAHAAVVARRRDAEDR